MWIKGCEATNGGGVEVKASWPFVQVKALEMHVKATLCGSRAAMEVNSGGEGLSGHCPGGLRKWRCTFLR